MIYFLNSSVRFYVNLLLTTLSFYTLAFILTTMTVHSDAYNQESYYIRDHTFDDVYIADEELAYFDTKSELMCSMSCDSNQQCKSFSYNTVCSVCQHFTVAFWEMLKSVSGINQSGWIHYDPPKPQSCEDLLTANDSSGVYPFYPHQSNGLRFKCELDLDGDRWTVIHQRFYGSVDFHRSWEEYKRGFGTIGAFWIGNEYLHILTSSGTYELHVDMSDWVGNSWYAVYKTFMVGDENSQFMLTIEDYSGNAGDSMSWHNGMKFSTVDRDNDRKQRMECSKVYGGNGGWWYNSCDTANLNGIYGEDVGDSGIEWIDAKDRPSNMKYSRMMIRRV